VVSVFQSAELDQPLRLSLNFSLFRELLSSLSSHVHATCDQPACATAHTRIRYILHHGRLARRHRHEAPGTLKCQNIHHNQRQQSVSHRGPAQAHGYRIRECSSVLGPYPDYAHSTAAVTMCGLIRIDVKPGARRGSSKRLRRLSDAQGSEARVHGMDGLSATRDPRAG
jgi:hypothetical protein